MHVRRTLIAVVALCSLFHVGSSAASEEARGPGNLHVEMALGADRIDWQPADEYEQVVLTIAGPEGLRFQKEFADSQSVSLSLFDQEGNRLPDGAYLYELRLVQRKVGPLSERPVLQAGSFVIRNGSFAPRFEAARPSNEVKSVQEPAIKNITAADEVVSDNLIVEGNACIGPRCESGDATSGTLRLKHASFGGPSIVLEAPDDDPFTYPRDWVIETNPFGQPDWFALRDLGALTQPFTVSGNSPDYSLVVGSGGKVGIGTAIPADRLHVLENVNANTLATVENSNTGTSAAATLRAKANVGLVQVTSHSSGRTGTRFGVALASRGEVLHTGGNGLLMGTLEADDLILGTNNVNRLQISGSTGMVTANNGLTVNGIFTNNSSRTFKENFQPVNSSTVLEKFAQLPVQEWSYKDDERKMRHVGPTVEDFQSAFGLGTDGKYIVPADVQGITMLALQGLYQVVQEKDTEISELRRENSDLGERLAALEELVSKLAAPE